MFLTESLVLKTFCHMVSPMFKPERLDTMLLNIDSKIRKSERRNPSHISGFSVLTRNTIAAARGAVERSGSADFPMCMVVMRRAAQAWASLSDSAKDDHSRMAARLRFEEKQKLTAEINSLKNMRRKRLKAFSNENTPRAL